VVQGDPAGVHIRPLLSFWDSQLHQWCSAIRDEFEQPAQYGSLYVDALTQAIIIHLLRHYSNTPRVEVRAPGKLSEQQQRQVQDYIATHLDQPLTVGELAGLLSLSTAHFDKLFRTTFQQAPYQYVLTQRVERAKALLRDERKTLFEVARECGFANQSHFTRHFKAIARVTPGRYARSRRASVMKTDKTRL
jgi:AraC family transcriptional regulator